MIAFHWRVSVARVLSLAAGFLVLGQGALNGQDPEAFALVEEAGVRYRGIQAFCAAFEQELEVPLLGETTYSRGTLCQERPNLFSMRFTDPRGDALVADGDHFWVFYPSVDSLQVIQFSMEVRPGGVDFHREFLDAPGEKYELAYEGQESVGGRATHRIHATPREAVSFREAVIWLDSARSLILRARVTMENGSIRTVTLSDIEVSPAYDPHRFRFTPPPGAQIIRRQ
jgi:outer membrane lipoprotein carrier protein